VSVAAFRRKPQIENQQFGGLVGSFLDQRLSSEEPLRTSCGALPRRHYEGEWRKSKITATVRQTIILLIGGFLPKAATNVMAVLWQAVAAKNEATDL
jgi:hypothetical protein